MSGKPAQLKGIQFGRGLAACLVVLLHAGHMLTEPQYIGHPFLLTWLFHFGNAGVDFFFVLSGFIIFYVHSSDIGRPQRLAHYLWQRTTRIYPIYWVVTSFVAATLVAKQDWAALNLHRVVDTVFLLPGPQGPLLGPAWTLILEVAFYVVFAIAIVSARAGLFVALAVLVLAAIGLDRHFPADTFSQNAYAYEFALGVLAAFAVKRSWPGPGWSWGIVGAVIFAFGAWRVDAGIVDPASNQARLWFGIASFLLLVGLAKAELEGRLKIPALGNYLGAASYSIYLVHVIVVGLSARVLFSIPFVHEIPVATSIVICFLAVVAGCILHTWVEKPLQNAIRGKAKAFATTGRLKRA